MFAWHVLPGSFTIICQHTLPLSYRSSITSILSCSSRHRLKPWSFASSLAPSLQGTNTNMPRATIFCWLIFRIATLWVLKVDVMVLESFLLLETSFFFFFGKPSTFRLLSHPWNFFIVRKTQMDSYKLGCNPSFIEIHNPFYSLP